MNRGTSNHAMQDNDIDRLYQGRGQCAGAGSSGTGTFAGLTGNRCVVGVFGIRQRSERAPDNDPNDRCVSHSP